MAESIKQFTNKFGLPRLIITAFFLLICVTSVLMGLPFGLMLSDVIRRFGMYGVLVLAMVPAIQSGIGPNFALPLGILCGLVGGTISMEIGLSGAIGFWSSIFISIPFAIVVGWCYALMLNKIKGSEMLVATYMGFSAVAFMCIMWILLPYKHPEMVWPIGRGLRTTVCMDSTYGQILNNFAAFNIGTVKIPTGLLIFFLGSCFVVWLFTRSKMGLSMMAAGDNPKFATASGINVDNTRIIGTILSTVLGGIGIIIYAQSFGFFQLYRAPEMMAFPAVAAVLIGGASAKKAKISHVILGVFLFQGMLAVALPVANGLIPEGNLSDVLRMIVQNGIILYALTQVGEGK